MPSLVQETNTVRRRMLALTVLALIVFGGMTAIAFALPSVCPSDTHASGTVCISDGSHPAPSTPSRTIPDYQTSRTSRSALRVEMVLVGMLVAGGLLWLGRRERS